MAIPYLNGGESITAASRNLLFENADRKLSEALSDHSLFFLYNTLDDLSQPIIPRASFGRKFFFWGSGVTSPPFWCKRFFGEESSLNEFTGVNGLKSYVHDTFSDAADATEVFNTDQVWAETGVTISPPDIVHDTTRKLVRLKFPVKSYWDAAGIVLGTNVLDEPIPNPTFFNYSLGIHTKTYQPDPETPPEQYQILQGQYTGAEITQWERAHLYDNAELIIEGQQLIFFPSHWNKYKFFRIHNFGHKTARVHFMAGDTITIDIPPYGSRCVRRDGSTWTEGYNHFHKVLSGDVRIFDGATNSPLNLALDNCQSNNVFNPKIIADIVQALTAGGVTNQPQFCIDPNQFWNAKNVYCSASYSGDSTYGRTTPTGGYFGDPESTTTKLGDLMFHKGKLLDIEVNGETTTVQQIDFRGFNTIAADLAAISVSVSYADDKQLILSSSAGDSKDLIGLSTNFICDFAVIPAHAPALPVNPSATHPFGYVEAMWHRHPGAVGTSTSQAIWLGSPFGDGGSLDFVIQEKNDSFFEVDFTYPFRYNETVGDLFNYLVDDAASTVENKQIRFTGFGAIMTADIITPLDKYLNSIQPVHDLGHSFSSKVRTSNALGSFDGENLTEKIICRVTTASFPSWTVSNSFYTNFPRNDQFYGTKVTDNTPTRNIFNSGYSSIGAASYHPDFTSYLDQAPAGEATVNTITDADAPQKTGAALLSPFSYYGNKNISLTKWLAGEPGFAPFGTSHTGEAEWYRLNRDYFINSNPVTDGSVNINDTSGVGAYFDRFPESIDTYNNLASIINGIVFVIPMFLEFVLPEIANNNASPFGSTTSIRPANHFATIADEDTEAFLTELGVPILGLEHLPATYHELINAENKFWRATPEGVLMVNGGDIVPGTEFFQYGEDGVNAAAGGKFLNEFWRFILFGNNTPDAEEYKWVSTEDIARLADNLNLPLKLQRAVLPLTFQFFPSSYSWLTAPPIDTRMFPALFGAFVPSATPDWICDPDTYRIREDYEAALNLNSAASSSGGGNVTVIGIDDDFRRRNWEGLYRTQPILEADRNRALFLFQNFSDTISTVVKIPEPTINWPERPDAIDGIPIFPDYIPAELVENEELGNITSETLEPGETFITPSSVCDRLQFFLDYRVPTPDAA